MFFSHVCHPPPAHRGLIIIKNVFNKSSCSIIMGMLVGVLCQNTFAPFFCFIAHPIAGHKAAKGDCNFSLRLGRPRVWKCHSIIQPIQYCLGAPAPSLFQHNAVPGCMVVLPAASVHCTCFAAIMNSVWSRNLYLSVSCMPDIWIHGAWNLILSVQNHNYA
jgi:hypothetical protein